MDYFNKQYNGGSPNLPDMLGDRFHGQDMTTDFWYLAAQTGRLISKLLKSNTVLISGGKTVQGSSYSLIDIAVAVGYVQFDVTTPDSFSSIPPTTQTETIDMLVQSSAESDFSLSTATLDGSTVNYLKLTYEESDVESRTRQKKTGSYVYKVSEDYALSVDSTPPTDYEIKLAEIIGDGSTFLTITDPDNYNLDKLHLNILLDEEDQADTYSGTGILYELSSPVLSSNKGINIVGSNIERNGNTGFGKLFSDRGCYYFGGSISYLELADQLQNNDSVEFWVYPDWGAGPSNDQYIIDTRLGATDTDDFVSLRFTTGNVYQLIAQDDGGNNVIISSGAVGSPNVLTHIKIAWSKATQTVKLFVDGADQGAGSTNGNGIQFINMVGKTGLVVGSEDSATNELPNNMMEAWTTDLLIHGAYDITTTHYSSGKPYMSENRLMGKDTDIWMDEHGSFGAKELWNEGKRVATIGDIVTLGDDNISAGNGTLDLDVIGSYPIGTVIRKTWHSGDGSNTHSLTNIAGKTINNVSSLVSTDWQGEGQGEIQLKVLSATEFETYEMPEIWDSDGGAFSTDLWEKSLTGKTRYRGSGSISSGGTAKTAPVASIANLVPIGCMANSTAGSYNLAYSGIGTTGFTLWASSTATYNWVYEGNWTASKPRRSA